jgi:plastocyanin domain-containing protein
MKPSRNTALLLAVGAAALACPVAHAAPPEFTLTIKDHRFEPTEVVVPAGQKVRLVIENKDPTPEEFESYSLNREKIVPGNGKIVLFVGPLEPGKYEFFGEFNMATARGWLIAR